MRKILQLILIALFYTTTTNVVKADSDQCVRFRLRIVLDNDSVITGDYFYYGMYLLSDLKFPPDSLTFDYILQEKKNQSYLRDTIDIYTKIILLKYPQFEFQYLYKTNVRACLKENELKIPINRIKNYTVIEKTTCYPEANVEYNYPGCGYSPVVITELTEKEITKLNTIEPIFYFEFNFDMYCVCESFCSPIVVSYNSKISKDTIIDILKNEWCLDWSVRKNNEELCVDRYYALKNKLSEMNIIIFRIYGYN